MSPLVQMIVPTDADPGVRACSEAWAECLREGGLDVQPGDLADASAEATTVIVEPHAVLRRLAADPQRVAMLLQGAVCVSTSRLGSGALGADRPFHAAAGASIALSRDSARYLSAAGIPTAHLAPGGHSRLRAHDAPERSIRVGTHARYSSYRENVIARSRAVLDPHDCDLRISHSAASRPATHLASDPWRSWLASIDVLVSLPAEPGPGTDWCEVGPAIMNGAVVLTTAESDYGPLDPGADVATATAGGFADSLRRLLADDERRDRIRSSSFERLSATPLDVTALADAIAAVAGHRRARPFSPLAQLATEQSAAERPDLAAAWEAADSARARRAQAQTGAADRVTRTSGWDSLPEPALSVIIPSHDQAGFVADAVESALAAVGVELEIVVVDDRSGDGSAAQVRAIMEAHEERAVTLVERGDNVGLAGARNHGLTEARAPLALLLDADDVLLPHGPAALRDALENDPEAAFAYGFLARFGPECEDLVGTEPWDPALFRDGNYIPVTGSLVRRSAWVLVGGYSAEGLLELGWEDLDFWLRLASAGQRAAHVRRIVGGYRVHDVSMSNVTNRHAPALMAFLRERHPGLMGADDA